MSLGIPKQIDKRLFNSWFNGNDNTLYLVNMSFTLSKEMSINKSRNKRK